MTFNEYLYTDAQDIELIFNYYLGFLGEMAATNFPQEKQLQLKAASDKFLNSIERFTYFETYKREDYEDLLRLLDREMQELKEIERKPFWLKLFPLINNRQRQIYHIQDAFRELYASSLALVNDAIQKEYIYDKIELGSFYDPTKSNKPEIIELIQDAVELINEDVSITEMSKKALVNHLDKAIRDLNSERTNWTRFFGKIKETSVVLAALASLAGNANLLYDAIEKLEKAAIVVRKTSVNISYNVLNEVFNVQNLQNIGLLKNTILKIDERKIYNDIPSDEVSE
ncbi:MAG: hypothetical protein NTZ33_09075 [Bacteroidetes bacterium]|nr:hypothetical protein [Bacteroidota bacterium]